MRCPYCGIGTKPHFDYTNAFLDDQSEFVPSPGYRLAYGLCTECNKLIVFLQHGQTAHFPLNKIGFMLDRVEKEELIYPATVLRIIEPEVPESYKKDFIEACSIVRLSPKSSAALSRRILQHILHEHFAISKRSLEAEIEEFINRKDVPSYLKQAVDAVRNIGNFAAHPLKDTHTGSIVDVEPGEAEWLLDVLESLFDFAFVQPARHQEKVEKLNKKLNSLGKPPMKEPKS